MREVRLASVNRCRKEGSKRAGSWSLGPYGSEGLPQDYPGKILHAGHIQPSWKVINLIIFFTIMAVLKKWASDPGNLTLPPVIFYHLGLEGP